MDEYLELQGVINEMLDDYTEPNVIEDVEIKNNRLYFRLNGHRFCTFGHYVYHEKNPSFDHPFTDLIAKRQNDAEEIVKEEERSERLNEEIDLWYKHKTSLYKLVFLKALELWGDVGEDAFVEYIDNHFDVLENGDNCKELIKLLEK